MSIGQIFGGSLMGVHGFLLLPFALQWPPVLGPRAQGQGLRKRARRCIQQTRGNEETMLFGVDGRSRTPSDGAVDQSTTSHVRR